MCGYSGDGGEATAAMLKSVFNMFVLYNTTSGGVVLYIADRDNNRVRRVNEGGIITTFAGTGVANFGGDGGAATAAQLKVPSGVSGLYNTSSGSMVLYIADTGNHRVRRVNEGGIITTVAGIGTFAFSGDGGAATAAQLFMPYSVSAMFNVSSNKVLLYIADTGNQRIRRVDTTGRISTVAGTGTAGFSGDGGAATAAQLKTPQHVVALHNVSSGGVVLYITERDNNRIRFVNEGGIITTVAGTGTAGFNGDGGPATAAQLKAPISVSAMFNASSGGVVLYIADSANYRVRSVDVGGSITTLAGTGSLNYGGDGGEATAAKVDTPNGLSSVFNASSGGALFYV
ncbi:MAG: hypothetical protein EOO65_05640, partial [Methanosarcinales archaeon]